MQEHLDAFMGAFIRKRCKHRFVEAESNKAAKRRLRDEKLGSNPMLGMDGLWRELDERYCTQLPTRDPGKELAFIRQGIAKFNLQMCYVLSAYEPWHQQAMTVEQALSDIVGSTSTTIISFIPGKVAYFEGHSIGDRWLCIREENAVDNWP
ncbi:hypothetical protein [Hymenobacter sp. B81]|uniref:hypothetical protein n=1 Tax=Hymenobacter sp. B81 TaxID=3344878 RepID=UPI0037DD33EC